VFEYLALVEAMVSASKNVESKREQFLGNERRNAKSAGAIFRVGDSQVDLIVGNQLLEVLRNNGAASGGKNIADE